MPTIKRILHPTDFSETAGRALRHAVHLARKYEAELHVLHVAQFAPAYAEGPLPGINAGSPSVPEYYEQLREEAEERLDRLIEQIDARGVRLRRVLSSGDTPAPVIVEYAADQSVDLIVVGTHGRRAMERFLLGSVAEEVLHRAPCDVLTVRRTEDGEAEPRSIQRILVPVDFSEASRMAVRRAGTWARDYGAQLDLLHVIEPPAFAEAFSGAVTVHDYDEEIPERVKEKLTELAVEVGREVRCEHHVEEGQPGKHIVEAAVALDADLIMMATRGQAGLRRIFLGSVTERVIRLATRPIYAVRV